MNEWTSEDLKRRIESGEPITVLDIRESDEFLAWSIHGSRNVPVYRALSQRLDAPLVEQAKTLPTDRPVVAVCRAGVVSRRAAQILGSLGFEAASLAGGIRGWGAVSSEATIPLEIPGSVAIQVRRNGKGCLSYLLGAGGEALVVDPSSDAELYLSIARRLGLRIVGVVETHVHADHLSRARALAREAGAALRIPANDRVTYPYDAVRDGDRIAFGGLALEAIATPGHTGESTCYRLQDALLLTGDTLFVNAVGRPDLERGDAGASSAAHALYRTLRDRLGVLPQGLRIFPCHDSRPVPLDGVPIGTTLGEALRNASTIAADEEAFASTIVESLQPKPPNFRFVIAVNEGKAGLEGIDPLDLEAGPNRCAAG